MFRATADYIKGSVAELRKVTWPTRKQVFSYTVIILVSVIIASLIISVVDYGLSLLVDAYLIK